MIRFRFGLINRMERMILQAPANSRETRLRTWSTEHPVLAGAAAAAGALAALALTNHLLARRAERMNPPSGRFLTVDGVRLHYVERGAGPPLVLLHGNGSMIADFASSGLIDLAAGKHRVIVFDRPGYGHSTRPRGTVWTADAQARLLHAALERLGASTAIVLGHSWGCSVAVAMALQYPDDVKGLVLASGYYYPTARVDMVLASAPAIPLVGDVLRYTVAPLAARMMWPLLMRKVFGPAEIPAKFGRFPKEMAVRPSQVFAEAAESALMIPTAAKTSDKYGDLSMPVAIVAGDNDRLIDTNRQSRRLHHDVTQSTFHSVPGAGHMVQQTHTVALIRAIDTVSAQLSGARQDREQLSCAVTGEMHAGDVRPAGTENMRYPPGSWDLIDQQADESFPASDPPGNY